MNIQIGSESVIRGIRSPSHLIVVSLATVASPPDEGPSLHKAAVTLSLGKCRVGVCLRTPNPDGKGGQTANFARKTSHDTRLPGVNDHDGTEFHVAAVEAQNGFLYRSKR